MTLIECPRFTRLENGAVLVDRFPERIAISQELLAVANSSAAYCEEMEVDGDVVLFTVLNGTALYERIGIGADPWAWEYRRVAVEMHPAWQQEG